MVGNLRLKGYNSFKWGGYFNMPNCVYTLHTFKDKFHSFKSSNTTIFRTMFLKDFNIEKI